MAHRGASPLPTSEEVRKEGKRREYQGHLDPDMVRVSDAVDAEAINDGSRQAQ